MLTFLYSQLCLLVILILFQNWSVLNSKYLLYDLTCDRESFSFFSSLKNYFISVLNFVLP